MHPLQPALSNSQPAEKERCSGIFCGLEVQEPVVLLRQPGKDRCCHEAAGLKSDRPARKLADKTRVPVAAMADCGCTLNTACMQHSLPALVVILELRIPDRGLIDVTRFAVTDLFARKA